jgi:hypothetical protein
MNLTRVFAAGQAYVALSRARSLEGLHLDTFNGDAVPRGVVKADPVVIGTYCSCVGTIRELTASYFRIL